MTACRYASFCGKRMAHGDRANGCSDVDEQVCDPNHRADTVTAPIGAAGQPYRKCCNCYRTRTRRDWDAVSGQRICECGSYSWTPVLQQEG